MPSVTLRTKELKTILKDFAAFSAQSIRKRPVVTFTFDPEFRMVLATDNAYISSVPRSTKDWDGQNVAYSFVPDTLIALALNGEEVTLEWSGDRSALAIRDKKFSTSLRVAAPRPSFDRLPEDMVHFHVPMSTLVEITKHLNIPQSYYKKKAEMMPVHFRSENGFLVAMADDGYSLGKIETDVPCPADLDAKIPKYILTTLFGSLEGKDIDVPFGAKGFNLSVSNKETHVFSSGLADQTEDFDTVYGSLAKFTFSCRFAPKELSKQLKPLFSMIPAKDRSGTFIEMEIKDKVNLSLRQRDVGEGKIEDVEGFSELKIESAAPRALLQMHPQAFTDYTALMDFPEAIMFANTNSVYYEGTKKVGSRSLRVRYLYPTVSV